MTTLIIDKNHTDEIETYKEKYKKVRILTSEFHGIDESFPVVFRVPEGIFYHQVSKKRLEDVIAGHADDLIVQSARVFSVEMKRYVSEPIYRKLVKEFFDILEDSTTFSSAYLVLELNQFVKEHDISQDMIVNPLKMALIKTIKGPSLPVLMDALGKQECLKRIEEYLRNYRYRM